MFPQSTDAMWPDHVLCRQTPPAAASENGLWAASHLQPFVVEGLQVPRGGCFHPELVVVHGLPPASASERLPAISLKARPNVATGVRFGQLPSLALAWPTKGNSESEE